MSPARPMFIAALALLTACGDAPTADSTDPGQPPAVPQIDLKNPANYAAPAWPAHYDERALSADNDPALNLVSDKGATLGRVLFYDRHLSVTDRVSCASCHQIAKGFTDSRTFSVGVDAASPTTRHAMRLVNARFYKPGRAFWDRSLPSLEAQALEPIQDPAEMGFDATHGGVDALIQKMQALPYYPDLFTWMYGDPAITPDRIQRAIAQFVRSIVSTDSRFDRAFAQVYDPMQANRGILLPFPAYTAAENHGKLLFFISPTSGGAGCGSCHVAPTFALTGDAQTNGLEGGTPTIFKAPSLRNVAVTGPYMHDGRFATLNDVIEHYASGVQASDRLDYRLRTPLGAPQRLNLSAQDRADLIAFLQTLTDPTMLSDPKYSDPFTR